MNTLITGNVKFFSQTENKTYITLLRKYQPFTNEEEVSAFQKLKENNSQAIKDEIVLRNQRWVYSLAKEYARDESEVMDYVNEGNLGLIEAIERFDIDKGFKFITYAVWYIRRAMNAYLNNTRDMVVKSNNAKLGKKLEAIKNDFMLEYNRVPSYEEIKEILMEKYDIKIIDDADLHDLDISSIDSVIDDGYSYEESQEFSEKTAGENEYIDNEEQDYIKSLLMPILSWLPKRERKFMEMLYHIGEENKDCTLTEICQKFNLDDVGLKNQEKKLLTYMKQQYFERVAKNKSVG